MSSMAEMGMGGHLALIWSRRFRASEANLDGLRSCLAGQSGAVVMLDSLRSISRPCGFGENDPEMVALIDDLKHQITEAGGTVLLVHHCNKANDTTGTEALSGHNAIAAAANTILKLHYLSQGNRLVKDSPPAASGAGGPLRPAGGFGGGDGGQRGKVCAHRALQRGAGGAGGGGGEGEGCSIPAARQQRTAAGIASSAGAPPAR